MIAITHQDFSENLMIVDLIRNDLGRVCRVDPNPITSTTLDETTKHQSLLASSVHVPSLMAIETYATVCDGFVDFVDRLCVCDWVCVHSIIALTPTQ